VAGEILDLLVGMVLHPGLLMREVFSEDAGLQPQDQRSAYKIARSLDEGKFEGE
jgi:hypothetical protein